MKRGRYLLRYAAGCYWLLDVEQDGNVFKKPLPLNETGAVLWQSLEKGMNREECAKQLAGYYEISIDQALADVQVFLTELQRNRIVLPDISSPENL